MADGGVSNPTNLDRAESRSTGSGGDDRITLGSGDNLVVGGAGADTIVGGSGFSVILGDSGRIVRAAEDVNRFGRLPITLGLVETMDDATGGADAIATGNGSSI